MAQDWNYLDLQNIRATLIRQEDTILFSLIERAQFKRNDMAYQVRSPLQSDTMANADRRTFREIGGHGRQRQMMTTTMMHCFFFQLCSAS